MPRLKAFHLTEHGDDGAPVDKGDLLVDFRGDEWFFLYPSAITGNGRAGKVTVIEPERYDSSNNGGREFYASVFDLAVREV